MSEQATISQEVGQLRADIDRLTDQLAALRRQLRRRLAEAKDKEQKDQWPGDEAMEPGGEA